MMFGVLALAIILWIIRRANTQFSIMLQLVINSVIASQAFILFILFTKIKVSQTINIYHFMVISNALPVTCAFQLQTGLNYLLTLATRQLNPHPQRLILYDLVFYSGYWFILTCFLFTLL